MDIGPGLAPGTTASGLMTEVIGPGREPAQDRYGLHVAASGGSRGCLIGPGPGECPGPMSPEGFRVLGFYFYPHLSLGFRFRVLANFIFVFCTQFSVITYI